MFQNGETRQNLAANAAIFLTQQYLVVRKRSHILKTNLKLSDLFITTRH